MTSSSRPQNLVMGVPGVNSGDTARDNLPLFTPIAENLRGEGYFQDDDTREIELLAALEDMDVAEDSEPGAAAGTLAEELIAQIAQLVNLGYEDDQVAGHYTLQDSGVTAAQVKIARDQLRPPPRIEKRSKVIRDLLGSSPGVFNKIEDSPVSLSKIRSLGQRWKAPAIQFDSEHQFLNQRIEVSGKLWDPADKDSYRGTIIKVFGKGKFASILWDTGEMSPKWKLSEVTRWVLTFTPSKSQVVGPDDWLPRQQRSLTVLAERNSLKLEGADESPGPQTRLTWQNESGSEANA